MELHLKPSRLVFLNKTMWACLPLAALLIVIFISPGSIDRLLDSPIALFIAFGTTGSIMVFSFINAIELKLTPKALIIVDIFQREHIYFWARIEEMVIEHSSSLFFMPRHVLIFKYNNEAAKVMYLLSELSQTDQRRAIDYIQSKYRLDRIEF